VGAEQERRDGRQDSPDLDLNRGGEVTLAPWPTPLHP
jgi:hypothetical protein